MVPCPNNSNMMLPRFLYRTDLAILSGLLVGFISTCCHHGTLSGNPFSRFPLKSTFLFSKNAFIPSFLSSLSYNCTIISESNRWAPSGEFGFLYIISRIRYVEIGDVWEAIWEASSSARGRTASGVGRVSAKRSPKCGDEAGNTPPVVVKYLFCQSLARWKGAKGTNKAFEYPIKRGR